MSSYPKVTHGEAYRISRPKKRKSFSDFGKIPEKEPKKNESASSKKIDAHGFENVTSNPMHAYRIIEFFSVFTTLSQFIICRECRKDIKFQETGHRGLGFKLVVTCGCSRSEINSGPLINTGYEINRRIVLVSRLLGIGREGINVFCNFMDLCDGISSTAYTRIIAHIYDVSKNVFKSVCEKAVREEQEKNAKNEIPLLNLKVSGDGTWKKRGFTSLYGVLSLIGYYTGKVLDLVVKSKFCQPCSLWEHKKDTEEYEEWKETHESVCSMNHEGSSGSMEVQGMLDMFKRSEEQYGVKYQVYIGDGDSKTFTNVVASKPYGENFIINKRECIGHISKRMGTRLREVRKKEKLGGKGLLTNDLIKKLSLYYGLAIRRNTDNLKDMKKAVLATFYHKISVPRTSGQNPSHHSK